jgi:hypothetical protein
MVLELLSLTFDTILCTRDRLFWFQHQFNRSLQMCKDPSKSAIRMIIHALHDSFVKGYNLEM